MKVRPAPLERKLYGMAKHTRVPRIAEKNPSAEQDYRMFHGRPSHRVRPIKLSPPPKEAWALGTVYSVIYEPFTDSGRGNTLWEHKFGDKGHGPLDPHRPLLVSSADGKHLYIFKDKSQFETEPRRGIVG